MVPSSTSQLSPWAHLAGWGFARQWSESRRSRTRLQFWRAPASPELAVGPLGRAGRCSSILLASVGALRRMFGASMSGRRGCLRPSGWDCHSASASQLLTWTPQFPVAQNISIGLATIVEKLRWQQPQIGLDTIGWAKIGGMVCGNWDSTKHNWVSNKRVDAMTTLQRVSSSTSIFLCFAHCRMMIPLMVMIWRWLPPSTPKRIDVLRKLSPWVGEEVANC